MNEHVCLLIDEVSRSSAKDCVINTVYFLKMFKREDAEMFARVIHDQKKNGLYPDEIFDLIFEKFTLLSKTQDAIIQIKKTNLTELKKIMEPNTCTYVTFRYKQGLGGHAVVIFKDDTGNLGIYDGQTHNLVNTQVGWKEWLESYKSTDLDVLYETDKRIRKSGRKDEKQPLKRVRKVSPEKPKNASVKSSSAKKSHSKTVKSAPKKNTPVVKQEGPKVKTLPEKDVKDAPVAEKKEPKVPKVKPEKKDIKKADLQAGLEKKHQLRITQKIKEDKKKRDEQLRVNRLPKMDVVEDVDENTDKSKTGSV